MKKQLLCFLCLCLPLYCMAQNTLARQYEYDAAGNRILRKVFISKPPEQIVPLPGDTITTELLEPNNPIANPTPQTIDYYVEYLAHVEIKIYPNPATEKITLEISQWETLQTGIFKLYSLTGQLLQERPVHSATTEVSLAGLASGAYILKVQINDRIEDWKIIKK